MKERHSKSGSASEKGFRLNEWTGMASELSILRAFSNRVISPQAAYSRLRNSTSTGNLWAAEIAISLAYEDTDNPTDWLANAAEMLEKSVNISRISGDKVKFTETRAAVLHAQLPVHAYITEKRLPPTEVALGVYERTVEAGYLMSQHSRTNRHSMGEDGYRQSSGLIAEIAALVLSQRAGLKIGSEDWFPISSTILDDQFGNRHGSTTNRAWDMNIYERTKDEPFIGWRVQVKSTEYDPKQSEGNAVGILELVVDSDLGIPHNGSPEPRVGLRIIEECYGEAFGLPNHSLTARIDQRHGQLLDLLEAA